MLKVFIVILLIAVLISLMSGLYFLVKDQGKSNRVVNALLTRVILSAALLGLIIYGFLSGKLGG